MSGSGLLELVSNRNLHSHSRTQKAHRTMVMAPGCEVRMLGFEY